MPAYQKSEHRNFTKEPAPAFDAGAGSVAQAIGSDSLGMMRLFYGRVPLAAQANKQKQESAAGEE